MVEFDHFRKEAGKIMRDRIILMNDIWDSLEKEDAKIESPSWHEDILKDRIERMDSNEVKYITLGELKAR